MIPHPEITIAIPVHNRQDIVGRTLRSVAAQTYRPICVILVDNASSDGTLDTLQAWADSVQAPDFQVQVLQQPVPGATAARNMALRATSTPWLMFFDSDDTMIPEHVEHVMEVVHSCPKVDMVGWDVCLRSLDGQSTVLPFALKDVLYHCIHHGTLATQRYAARTEIFRDAGMWDETVPVWNDIELGTRILCSHPNLHIRKIEGEPEVTVYQTAESITGTSYHANGKGRELALSRILSTLSEKDRGMVRLKMAILAALYRREGHTADAKRLKAEALAAASSASERSMLRLAYAYTAAGLRGIARIVSPYYCR